MLLAFFVPCFILICMAVGLRISRWLGARSQRRFIEAMTKGYRAEMEEAFRGTPFESPITATEALRQTQYQQTPEEYMEAERRRGQYKPPKHLKVKYVRHNRCQSCHGEGCPDCGRPIESEA